MQTQNETFEVKLKRGMKTEKKLRIKKMTNMKSEDKHIEENRER